MSKEIVHYDMDPIESKGATINLIWGERANGKSYQVKHKRGVLAYLQGFINHISNYNDKEKIIEESIKKGTRFILLRRWREEISTDKIEKYFSDVDIQKITDGKYNCVLMYKKTLYLGLYDFETGKASKHEIIGYVCALSTEQNYAGVSYLDVTNIIFEEFMSRNVYLANEPAKLMNFYSTVDRKRGTTRLWLVGNSISRVCPYLQDWGLQSIIDKQKQGENKTLWISTCDIDPDTKKPIEVKLAIEYCKSTGARSYVIGNHASMLNTGSWQTDPQPHLSKSKKCYNILYRLVFYYKGFKFLAEYLSDKETTESLWFIFPYDGEIDNKTLVISDIIKQSPLWQRNVYDIRGINEDIKDLLYNTFRENQIFYSSDLAGTDFKQVIDFEIKR